MKILALVASIPGEKTFDGSHQKSLNPGRRKGKGFLATLVDQESVGPKAKRKRDVKGEAR